MYSDAKVKAIIEYGKTYTHTDRETRRDGINAKFCQIVLDQTRDSFFGRLAFRVYQVWMIIRAYCTDTDLVATEKVLNGFLPPKKLEIPQSTEPNTPVSTEPSTPPNELDSQSVEKFIPGDNIPIFIHYYFASRGLVVPDNWRVFANAEHCKYFPNDPLVY